MTFNQCKQWLYLGSNNICLPLQAPDVGPKQTKEHSTFNSVAMEHNYEQEKQRMQRKQSCRRWQGESALGLFTWDKILNTDALCFTQ